MIKLVKGDCQKWMTIDIEIRKQWRRNSEIMEGTQECDTYIEK